GLANVADFVFHFWMGRTLSPAEFAILQTLNSVLLIYISVSGVFQPAVGRFVAEARALGEPDSIPSIFLSFAKAAFWVGLVLAALVAGFSRGFSMWLNLPVWSIQVSAVLIFLSTLRPVAMGVLQGLENFVPLGLARLLTALGRLVIGVILVGSGLRLRGAVTAIPLGWIVGVLAAYLSLGRSVWARTQPVTGLLGRGWELSLYALLAYLAFMSLTSLDLVWVNRMLPGDLAGAYASLVLLRRVIALLPAAAVTVMFPRIAAALAQDRLPDRLLLNAAVLILATSGGLALLYFGMGDRLILATFGAAYAPAAAWLGWMGIAMAGISLSSIWLNYYLAEQPAIFVTFLGAAVVLEWALLAMSTPSIQSAVLAFGITGWSLALGGLILYLGKFRPALQARQAK
ncbi:MAG TPA: hypothetical protein VGJ22_12625, partial [Anaerolineales bacterium]